MEELINSDLTMLAATSFNNIVQQIQTSCLNYKLKVTPFSAFISIRKTLIKDQSGYPIIQDIKVPPKIPENDWKYLQLKQDYDALQIKQKESLKELAAAYETIEGLKMVNRNHETLLDGMSKENRTSKEAVVTLNKALKNKIF